MSQKIAFKKLREFCCDERMMCATMYGKLNEKFMILLKGDFRFFFKNFPNCQKFPFQTVKIFLFKLSKFSISKLTKFPFQNTAPKILTKNKINGNGRFRNCLIRRNTLMEFQLATIFKFGFHSKINENFYHDLVKLRL